MNMLVGDEHSSSHVHSAKAPQRTAYRTRVKDGKLTVIVCVSSWVIGCVTRRQSTG